MYVFDPDLPTAVVKPAIGRPSPVFKEGYSITEATGVAINYDSPLMKWIGPWLRLTAVEDGFIPPSPWAVVVELAPGQTVANADQAVVTHNDVIAGIPLAINGATVSEDADVQLSVSDGEIAAAAVSYDEEPE